MPLKESIVAFGQRHTVATDRSWYQWKFPEKKWRELGLSGDLPKDDFEKTIAMKRVLSKTYSDGDPETKKRLVKFFVQDWGGVRGHHERTIEIYATGTVDDLIARKTAGIASWSKALNLRDPDKFPIYDSRVALALNVLAKRGGDLSTFPLVASRNAGRDRAVRAALKASGRNYQAFYERYQALLNEAATELRVSSQVLEMLLFAKGPELWDEFVGAWT
jgi:hypothetical protein